MKNASLQINADRYSHRGLAIGLMAFGQTVVWATLFYVFPAMVLQWEAAHGWSKVQLTGAITLALLLSAIASPLVGRLIDRGAGALVLCGGACFGAVFLYLLTWAHALWQFYLLWALLGVMLGSCLYEPCFMLVTRAYGSGAKRYIITITLIAGFASTISFPTVHFIALHYGWQAVLQTFSGAALLLGAPALLVGGSILEKHAVAGNRAAAQKHRLRLHRQPAVIQLGLCFALLAVVHGATLHHLLPVLTDRQLTIGHAVLVASLIGPMQVVGRLVMTALQSRVTHVLIAFSCFLFIGLSMIFLYLSSHGLALAILFAVMFGGSYGVVSIIRPVIARDFLGDTDFGAKSGFLAFFYLIGAALSPYLGSVIWLIGGYDLMLPVLAGLALAGLWAIRRVVAREIVR